MELFVNDRLNPGAFDASLCMATHNLNDVLLSAAQTQSARIQPEHFLMALSNVDGGETRKSLKRFGLAPDSFHSGLQYCVSGKGEGMPPEDLSTRAMDGATRRMLEEAERTCSAGLPRIPEGVLLMCALQHASAGVRELCEIAGVNVDEWIKSLERSLTAPSALAAFDESGKVVTESFSASGKKVLHLMRTEAESLGHSELDPRHLLMGLLLYEGGATEYGLHLQHKAPRELQAAVALNLKRNARSTRSTLALERAHMQTTLAKTLSLAGELAARREADRIAETHLLAAFLSTQSVSKRILEDERVDTRRLIEIAEEYDPGHEEDEDVSLADIETVRRRLLARLVGQDEAVERVLPYVQRMRFGFTSPGRPAGVFLFCGPSGTGKTEMAKELARALYGSEEQLVFLEMGQFNSAESMNIFVGAPPGYVGYGEGKLTNGLRDKPQSVVLFDEVEKANPKVLDALLRFIDEGKIDDPAGPVRDGTKCLVILTSNVGSEQLGQLWQEVKGAPNWRTLVRTRLRDAFRQHNFRVEFLNRVDELILFRPMDAADYAEVARRILKRDCENLLSAHRIEVSVEAELATLVGDYCESLNEGARAVRRLVNTVVITPVIDHAIGRSERPLRVGVRAYCMDGEGSEPYGEVHEA